MQRLFDVCVDFRRCAIIDRYRTSKSVNLDSYIHWFVATHIHIYMSLKIVWSERRLKANEPHRMQIAICRYKRVNTRYALKSEHSQRGDWDGLIINNVCVRKSEAGILINQYVLQNNRFQIMIHLLFKYV